MSLVGKLDGQLLPYAAVAVPFSLVGAAVGVRAFISISEQSFRRAILVILLASGGTIVAQSVLSLL